LVSLAIKSFYNYTLSGHAEHMASLTEGLATTLECFKDLTLLRDPGLKAQKFCILICNSPPYNLPVMDLPSFRGLTLEQLAVLVNENNIQLSIISPRRIPTWVT
jgi:mediator of RNA polymerase II transcription subunit 25